VYVTVYATRAGERGMHGCLRHDKTDEAPDEVFRLNLYLILKNITTVFFFHLFLLLCILPAALNAQISGRVTDETGQPLPFATVYLRNTSNGVVANAGGEYRLTAPKGDVEVVFQYMGYQQRIERVTVGDRPIRLNVQMEPSDLELAEVVITTEDPAVGIMRKAIAQRRYFRERMGDHTCDAYIKGFYKLNNAPKKFMGKDIGDMEGILDSATRSAVVYLSESVSKLYVQGNPVRKKEVLLSSKVSGDNRGFSLNRATFIDFNLYDEYLEVERDLLSPLADQALSYYKVKLLGKYQDQNGYNIYKIGLKPRRPNDPVFSGEVYIVDEQWNLAGASLYITGAAIKQPILDTLRIDQQFVPLEKPDRWGLLSQITTFKFGIFGFKIGGFFNSLFSNYDLKPRFAPNFFQREIYKIEPLARERDTFYWAGIRPMPLTAEESRDYIKKDSLQRIRTSDRYRDSLDWKNNRFKVSSLLSGYNWRNSRRQTYLNLPGAFSWLQFNTVQGYVLNAVPTLTRYLDEDETRFWKASGVVNYGFSEDRLRGTLRVERRFEGVYQTDVAISGGIMTTQFDENRPIVPIVNSFYSALLRRNYLKLYDKSFLRLNVARDLAPWLRLSLQAEYALRSPLENRTNYSWVERPERVYTPNVPRPTRPDIDLFAPHRAFIVQASANIAIGRTYETYPTYRNYNESRWPQLQLQYRAGLPNVGRSETIFHLLSARLHQSKAGLGLLGYAEWALKAGVFLGQKPQFFMDRYHPLANEIIIGDNRIDAFNLLPYYEYSTNRGFAEVHWCHHAQGWLLDKIPGIRRLNWKEVLIANVLYQAQPNLSSASDPLPDPIYWEIGAGFENIGWKAIRPLRVDLTWAFRGAQYDRAGVVLRFGF
jgi:Family of unknown function (DUF5686)/CarboxypepD_reg-like domain